MASCASMQIQFSTVTLAGRALTVLAKGRSSQASCRCTRLARDRAARLRSTLHTSLASALAMVHVVAVALVRVLVGLFRRPVVLAAAGRAVVPVVVVQLVGVLQGVLVVLLVAAPRVPLVVVDVVVLACSYLALGAVEPFVPLAALAQLHVVLAGYLVD